MRDAYAVDKVRAAEAALMAQVPEGTLMQRAAAGLAAVCAGLLRTSPGAVYGARVAILAGSGDNGGDALYAGELLARRGASVTAIAGGTRLHAAAARALTAAGGRVIPVPPPGGTSPEDTAPEDTAPEDTAPEDTEHYDPGPEARQAIGRADLILDGMLGIGGKGGLREPYATLARLAADTQDAVTVAVDLPSGIDADTGEVAGPAIQADVTVTFGALKPGLLIDPGAGRAGVVEFVDIGLGPYLGGAPDVRAPQAADIAALLPRPTAESDKYRRGVLGLLVGSDRFTGAALLATGGAVHGGTGMIRLVTFPGAAAPVRLAHPEVIITELTGDTRIRSDSAHGDPEPGRGPRFPDDVGRVQAWAVGSGMGTDDAAAQRLAAVLATDLPVLIDADALTVLSQHKELLPRSAPTLITPHAGELGRLLGADPADIEARRLEHARRAADTLGLCVLLKGSTTVIATPGGSEPVLVNTTGTPWLATAGTGDVLAGLAGALLAQGLQPPEAAITAAYLHGLAARYAAAGAGPAGGGNTGSAADAPIGAADVAAAVPQAFRAL